MLKPEATRRYDLTPSEAQVIGLLCQGLSTKHILHKLDRSLRTVEMHTYSAFRKLGVHKDRAAIAKLYRERLVELPDV